MPSPHLARVPAKDLRDDLCAAREHSMRLRGDATFFEVFGHHPELYRWYTESFYAEVLR